jgi:uncharacterized protein (TIGR00661 family)
MSKQKNILVCPLDWGLGHTTRCIPILKYLLEENYTVFVACTTWQKQVLSKELIGIQFIDFFGYNINYSAANNLTWAIAKQIPKLLKIIKKEHQLIDEIIKKYNIDLVISDNRYGCYSNKIPSVFITHQTKIKSPIFSSLINKINRKHIANYSQCWIPDFENHYLSGDLSTTEGINNAHFIGALSRLQKNKEGVSKKYDLLFLLSGPEPQRTLFENKILSELAKSNATYFLVRGIVDYECKLNGINNENYINYCTSSEIEKLIQESELVICRSGYSSIMDLQVLQAKAYFVPTPGQTEQEFLAEYFNKKNIAGYSSQNDFLLANLKKENYKGFSQQSTNTNQKEIILKLIAKLF